MYNRSNVMKIAHAETRHQLRFPSRFHPTYAQAFAKHLKQAIANECNRVACERRQIEMSKRPQEDLILTGNKAEIFMLEMKDHWTLADRERLIELKAA